jgi:hypothetical protein
MGYKVLRVKAAVGKHSQSLSISLPSFHGGNQSQEAVLNQLMYLRGQQKHGRKSQQS